MRFDHERGEYHSLKKHSCHFSVSIFKQEKVYLLNLAPATGTAPQPTKRRLEMLTTQAFTLKSRFYFGRFHKILCAPISLEVNRAQPHLL